MTCSLLVRRLRKILLVMTLKVLILLVAFGSVSAMGYSQEQKMDVVFHDEMLENVLEYLKTNTDYEFVYRRESLGNLKVKNVELKDVTLKQVLDQVLRQNGFDYEIVDKIVIVRKIALNQQKKEIKITGRVTDEKGEVLPGVTVIVKGTQLGTATDMDGKYSLTLPEGKENHTLVFTMVGMETKEVVVGKQTGINVVMKDVVSELDDVIVTGYYTQAKNSFTGAARTITAEELQQGGNQNILSALQNIDPSFVKLANNQMGSNPNTIPDFQIRGAGSISGVRDEYSGNPNMPVFIVDGFETTAEKVFDMDPYRVATITLLKDAAATAIYGSRASNGVVVITTVAPAGGKMSVSYNGDMTFYAADLTDYNLCNAEEKLNLEVLSGMYDISKRLHYTQDKFSDKVYMDEAYNQRLANVREGVNTYWLDKPLNNVTLAHKHSLRLDGGNDYIRYAMEVNYNNTPGVMKESGRERIGLGMELQYIYKGLTFRNQLNYSRVKAKNSPYGSFSEYTKMNPYVKYKDEEGNLIYTVDQDDRWHPTVRSLFIYNPLYNATLNVTDESGYNDLTNLFGIDWYILEGLRLKGSFSFTLQNTFEDVFKPAKHTDFAEYTGDDFDRRGSYTASRGDNFSYDASVVLNYFWRHQKHVINSNL